MPRHLPEALRGRFQVFDDVVRRLVRVRQVVQIGEALVLKPEEIEAGLVPDRHFLVTEATPPTIGIRLRVSGFLALMKVFGMVALNEVPQVLQFQGVLLQGVVDGSLRGHEDAFDNMPIML